MGIGRGVDQLRVDVHATTQATDRALQNTVHAKFAGDVAQGSPGSFILHHRGARDHTQTGVFGEHGDQLVGRAIGEIVLGGITGEVLERQHRERLDVRFRVSASKPSIIAQAVRIQRDEDGSDSDSNHQGDACTSEPHG